MIWKLTTDEIPKYWDLIKYGINQVEHPDNKEIYFINLLKNLLLRNLYCVFLIDEKKTIKMMLTLKITEDFGKSKSLVLETIYGFIPTTDQEKLEGYDFLMKFAKNNEVNLLVGQPSHSKVAQIAEAMGFKKRHEVYQLKIGS